MIARNPIVAAVLRSLGRFVGHPPCQHAWKVERLGDLQSGVFYGDNLKRTCTACGLSETGWSQYGRRYDETGKPVEMERIHWHNETEWAKRMPNDRGLPRAGREKL